MSLFGRGHRGLFSSAHLSAHLLRGAAAAGFIYWAVTHQQPHPVGALLAGVAALLAMRGCPMCWLAGLVETISIQQANSRKNLLLQDSQRDRVPVAK